MQFPWTRKVLERELAYQKQNALLESVELLKTYQWKAQILASYVRKKPYEYDYGSPIREKAKLMTPEIVKEFLEVTNHGAPLNDDSLETIQEFNHNVQRVLDMIKEKVGI